MQKILMLSSYNFKIRLIQFVDSYAEDTEYEEEVEFDMKSIDRKKILVGR